jgi:hypothetical protein
MKRPRTPASAGARTTTQEETMANQEGNTQGGARAFYRRCVEIGAPRCGACGHHHFEMAPHVSLGLAPPFRRAAETTDEAVDMLEITPEIAAVLDSVGVDEVPEQPA